MKLADLDLDTIYADTYGRPLMLLSLEKFGVPKGTYGPRHITPTKKDDKSFGVLVLLHAFASRTPDMDDLRATAQPLRDGLPKKEMMAGDYSVEVATLRSIVEAWDAHLERKRAEARRRKDRAAELERKRAEVTATIDRINELLPEGVTVHGLNPSYDAVRMSHADLLALLER